MLKKTLSLVLSAVLVAGLVPAFAFADGGWLQGAETAVGAGIVAPQASDAEEAEGRTALDLFTYIRDNSESGSGAYLDAQCAIDILTGTTTQGVEYPSGQGPEQDGWSKTATNGASNANAYKAVALDDPDDAASLAHFDAALDFIDEYNAYRKKENAAEGTKLSTNVGMNCRMMAISIVQCDWSRAVTAHSGAYNVGENLAWGYAGISPFEGWYTEEKANYQAANGGQTGHYLNIVDGNGTTLATGFAVAEGDALYGICHEQSFHVVGTPNITYTTSQFRAKWFDAYYQGQDSPDKKANPMQASAKKKTVKVKARALKKKAKKVSNIKVKNAKGKVTFKNVSKNKKAKKFKVTSKGKVKVKKGTKKGKYKVIVKVKAAGNATYQPATKKVKFTIRVK